MTDEERDVCSEELNDVELTVWEGPELDAVIGVVRIFNRTCVVYDEQRLLDILRDDSDGPDDDVREHLEYNIAGAYVGEATPGIFVPARVERDENGVARVFIRPVE